MFNARCFYCIVLLHDDTVPRSVHGICSVDFRCRHPPPDHHRIFGRSIYTHASGPRDHRWVSWLLASPSSIIDARSDWEIAPLRQGGIHATFLRISCRNIEHTRHMGGILLLCACAITLFIHCSSMWEKVCIIHEIISAYNDESNEYQHSELLVNKWTKAI